MYIQYTCVNDLSSLRQSNILNVYVLLIVMNGVSKYLEALVCSQITRKLYTISYYLYFSHSLPIRAFVEMSEILSYPPAVDQLLRSWPKYYECTGYGLDNWHN